MPDRQDTPTPDEHGRYRVAETVGGQTRHYSTFRFIPGVHRIVEGPDAAASFKNGQERPPKFPTDEDDNADSEAAESPAPQESPPTPEPQNTPATATAASPEGATP